MNVFKHRIFTGRLANGRFFDKIEGGFRLFVRLTGVNIEKHENGTFSVQPVYTPVLDVTKAGVGLIVQISWDLPRWLVVVYPFRIHIERLNELAVDFDERYDS
jgi:hypothetical protein